MKKKIICGGLTLVVIMAALWLGSRFLPGGTGLKKAMSHPTGPVSAEDVAADPGRHNGFLELEGVVTGLAGSGGVFFLGCPDGCLSVPVKYPGRMPVQGSNLIVYGELKQQDGKYIFEGKELSAR